MTMKKPLKQYHLVRPSFYRSSFYWTITIVLLMAATLLGYVYVGHAENFTNIALLYILALVLIARFTDGYLYSVVASLISVFFVNYLFTYPFFRLNFTLTGYPVTFIGMLGITLITCTTTTRLKKQMQIVAERESLLLEAEKEKMRANLLRAISHDLRTPLTGIIGASSSYLENSNFLSKDAKQELVSHISEDANWLLNMVENLLSVTRIKESAAQVKKTWESVEEVVSAAILRLKKRNPTAQITVRVPDELLMIPMDAILIEQVLINLLENALTHSKSNSSIFCFVDFTDLDVTFHIRDYGVGIAPHRLKTIFDGTAYLNGLSPDSTKGMGIGLSICKTIIHAHGGQIHACNHKTGSEFYFSLPKTNQEENL